MKNVPLVLLSLEVARILYFSASIGDALSICALVSLYGYQLYLSSIKTVEINQKTINEINILREQVLKVEAGLGAVKIAKTFR